MMGFVLNMMNLHLKVLGLGAAHCEKGGYTHEPTATRLPGRSITVCLWLWRLVHLWGI